MSSTKLRVLFVVSLFVNVAVAGIAVRAIYLRGGWTYLQQRVHQSSTKASSSLDEDAMQYLQRQTLFEHLPTHKNSIVFLGDSQTAGCEWGEFFPGALNRGIGGDTSAGVLKRLFSITQLTPRAIFLMIGANDLYNLKVSPEQTASNIRTIVQHIQAASPQTLIFLESVMPTFYVKRNEFAQQVNQSIKSLADGKSVFYLDLYSPFLEGTTLDHRYSYDGLHLNGDGYQVWRRVVQPYVEKLS